MVVCAAPKCQNSSRIKEMRFFKFPSEAGRRKVWIENSGLTGREPGSYAKLCDIHFEESQFELHRQDGWKKLKPNAVPTVFPEPRVTPKSQKSSKRKRSLSPRVVHDVDDPQYPKRKSHKHSTSKHDDQSPRIKKKSPHKKDENATPHHKDNLHPKRRKGRPRKVPPPDLHSSSETEIEVSEEEVESAQEKQIAVLKRENETMRQEIQEFEKHNKAMSRVILELEKHNKAMSVKLQELDKDNKVMSRKLQDLEKQNEDLKSKLNCCFSEEQFQRMEKLMALGKIERYIPALK